ncbi:D-Ala-D-Ala carboxypeptidase family metallohydrolase [Parabacteroides sp. GYB001]|uniref:D-Ala-D-Ala carboxypeptidase family metallohydrolase n=1 Tax=Parabacteroides leei TaxID=2939491 RepID=UPI002016F660|nr:D-Ala-D-Ala carboxypeptidase family metallohydrolase [Parabacteroides leei]MCL3851092.1 D-Ala-D-Ala carboxypeptidase family metallohydrolase [Parabacteroides leei]
MKKNISRDFTWEEMTYSNIAVLNGLRNDPPEEARDAIRELVKCLLQPLRIAYNKPIAITSGYRSLEVNRLAGGVRSSQHVKGEAADCYVPDIYLLLDILKKSGLSFDQAILYRKKHFLHLSYKVNGKQRRQILYR